ncbi:MAG TPA: hypothetical protein DDY13_04535 [Cytophagales bacterium]|jgi:rhodanese-related sulfurtransferase|nr:hypothetical protein [Cytophagales bacterium]
MKKVNNYTPRLIASLVMVLMGFVAAVLPPTKNSSTELNAEQLLRELKLESHAVSVDELAQLLIDKDPSILLIDLRSKTEYDTFHLPGAINIPFDSLFTENWVPYVDQGMRNNVFYSNGTTLSTEAWMLTRQRGFKNNYYLRGGLNEWFTDIILPVPPEATESKAAFDLYQKRVGAKMFFTGNTAISAPAQSESEIKLPVPQKKKQRVEGGCS